MDKNKLYDKMMDLVEMIGSDTFINEVSNYFSSDDLEDFLTDLDRNYETGLFDDDDNEEDEEDY